MLYISEKLQDCINQVEPAGADMLGSELHGSQNYNETKSIRKYSERIMDLFLKKYVFNAIDLEHLKGDEAADEQMGPTRKPSDPGNGQQMRGFELITKVMEHVTIMDWLKISRSLHSMQGVQR